MSSPYLLKEAVQLCNNKVSIRSYSNRNRARTYKYTEICYNLETGQFCQPTKPYMLFVSEIMSSPV